MESKTIERDSIHVGTCYRDRLGAIYRVVGFDGNGVQCVLYCPAGAAGFTELEHFQSWTEFLENFDGEAECPLSVKRTVAVQTST